MGWRWRGGGRVARSLSAGLLLRRSWRTSTALTLTLTLTLTLATQVVADIYCNACDTRLGWKYVEAFEESQKYKEGRFILEKAMIIKEG